MLIAAYAASLVAAVVLWHLCTLFPNRWVRAVFRAAFVAVLCAPGILIGHGVGVAPTVFVLAVQPTILTLGSILIVFVVTLGIILGVPALRRDSVQWPPSAEQIFIGFYGVKFVIFGLVAALLMLASMDYRLRGSLPTGVVRYGLFFAMTFVNLVICYWAARARQANPILTPLLFSAPALLVTSPVVGLMWYGGGAVGAMVGCGNLRTAARISFAVFGLLTVYSLVRVYLAYNAAPHVNIVGGVAGNAALAVAFAALAIAPWWLLRNRA